MNSYAAFERKPLKKRARGSCRFAPYYKAQWYDEATLAWRDVAKRFETPNKARARFDDKHLWRIMEVSMSGRNVI